MINPTIHPPKRGRPRLEENKLAWASLRLPQWVLDTLGAEARQRDQKRGTLMRQILTRYAESSFWKMGQGGGE